jgi:hypothetical protein
MCGDMKLCSIERLIDSNKIFEKFMIHVPFEYGKRLAHFPSLNYVSEHLSHLRMEPFNFSASNLFIRVTILFLRND